MAFPNGRFLTDDVIDTEIRAVADELASGLLVCGARGESLLRHMLLGSTAERMLSNTTRPLLVVKQAPHGAYKTVLVPLPITPLSKAAWYMPMWIVALMAGLLASL